MNGVRLRVTEHAINQFKSRILMNELPDNKRIIDQIKNIFFQARYISDNENGILFRNDDLMIEFIVKKNNIITLFPIKKGK